MATINTTTNNTLSEPLSMKQMVLATSEENTYLQGNIVVSLVDIIDNDFEWFIDTLSEKLVGNSCLMDVTYKFISITEDESVVISVSGDVSNILEITKEMFEEFKSELFMHGTDALEDFADMDLSAFDDKDTIDSILDDVAAQMPDDDMMKFYRKYMK